MQDFYSKKVLTLAYMNKESLEISIKELAESVKAAVGYEGDIVWNTDMPDGTPRKLTNVEKLHGLGFKHKVELKEGIELSYKWFCENVENARL